MERRGIKDDHDLLGLGMDPLQALTIIRQIRRGLGMAVITPTTLYTHPTITSLTFAIPKLAHEGDTSRAKVAESQYLIRQKLYRDSTGTLGAHLFQTLLASLTITHIYCLNRSPDGSTLQPARNKIYVLPNRSDLSRVTFFHADLAQPHMGLDPEINTKLHKSTSLIIHNAWPVNFNHSRDSFRPQLNGIINVIEHTASTYFSSRLIFISSISSVMAYPSASGIIPEEIIPLNLLPPGRNGYADSKLLSEILLDHATKELSIDTTIARFLSLVLSLLHIGAVPESLGGSMLERVDWIPVDRLLGTLVDLALYGAEGRGGGLVSPRSHVLHPHNPHAATWTNVITVVADELRALTGKRIEAIPLRSWREKVKVDAEGATNGTGPKNGKDDLAASLKVNPAIKLLDLYEGLLAGQRTGAATKTFAVDGTLALSSRLQELESLKSEWIRKWVREWVTFLEAS
ncbi:hypothetical protein MMC25_006102 [Agyrium rufum]|nr:hypothetical protein [Agyrium rufum]